MTPSAKIEATEFSVRTIDATLEHARSQLPNDRPGIVFLKLPPRWLEMPRFAEICVAVARDFLRTTRRVVSVKYYTSPVTFVGGTLNFSNLLRRYVTPSQISGIFMIGISSTSSMSFRRGGNASFFILMESLDDEIS